MKSLSIWLSEQCNSLKKNLSGLNLEEICQGGIWEEAECIILIHHSCARSFKLQPKVGGGVFESPSLTGKKKKTNNY